MIRQAVKRAADDFAPADDLKFLLSNVRARENGLVFFLELFSMASRSCHQSQQYRIYKQEFLEKQKIYTAQIRQLEEKLLAEQLTNIQVRSFWSKLKSILQVSLERARTMGLLTDTLARKYEEVMALVGMAHEQAFQLKEYMRVEQMLKKRTVQALVTTKQLLIGHPLPDNLEANKNRSETFLKLSSKPTESLNLSPNHPKISHMRDEVDASSMNKLKSMTRGKKKGDKMRVQLNQSQTKKAQSAWHRYERVIADVMDCRLENLLDKKKTKTQNEDRIYDQLFQKNIANHKMITKYGHNCIKLKVLLTQITKAQKQRLVSQKKFNCGVRQQFDAKPEKLVAGRPKTSKKQKVASTRMQSGQSQKFTELVKGA